VGYGFRQREAAAKGLLDQLLFIEKRDARPAGRSHLHGQRRLKNVLEQIALEDTSWRPYAKALPFLEKDDLIRIFSGEIQLVRDDNDGVAVFRGETTQGFEEIDLRADIQVKRRLVEKKKERLLSKRPSEDDALLFATGDFVHPAIGEMRGTHLREGVVGDGHVFFRDEAQTVAVSMTALQNKFPNARREQQTAFLLDEGDTLSANLRRKIVGGKSVEKDATRERLQRAGDQLQERGLAAGIGAKNRDEFPWLCLKAKGFQREERRLRRARGVDVACLFDAQADIGIAALLVGRGI